MSDYMLFIFIFLANFIFFSTVVADFMGMLFSIYLLAEIHYPLSTKGCTTSFPLSGQQADYRTRT